MQLKNRLKIMLIEKKWLDKVKYHKEMIIIMLGVILITAPLFLLNTGLGHDDCAIILAALKLLERSFFDTNVYNNIFARLFDFSHGGFNLTWILGFYVTAAFLKIPLFTWVFTLPATISAWLSAIVVYFYTYIISQKRFISFLAFLMFLLIPISIGMGRQYFYPLTFIRIFFLFSILVSLIKDSVFWKRISIIILGIMIFSDNGFLIYFFLGTMQILLYKYNSLKSNKLLKRIICSVHQTVLYYLDIVVLFPIMIVIIYIILYLKPIHAGYGFIAYTLNKKSMFHLSIQKDILYAMMDNMGLGMGLLYPIISIFSVYLLFIKEYSEKKIEILILIIWFWVWIIFGLLVKPWNLGKMYLFEFTFIPFAILTALSIDVFLRKYRNITIPVILFLFLLNIISCISFVFDYPYRAPQVYGAARSWDIAKTFKAVGTILRFEGYH